ncbi:MAG: sodium:alanine symporter family protein [Oscillospiraceae bacterium]|nr:sodium:alanine symporter family protein [Oscillospiraceae bacterium]
MTEIVSSINSVLNALVWGLPMMGLIIGVGLYFSIRTGFPQLRKFGYAMKNTVGKVFSGGGKAEKGALSPFQALTTALAGTVGTGNIAGVAGAISLGGPGAVFWMWASSFLGMATKYAEILLAVKFRRRSPTGEWIGGPMYYITDGLGRSFRWLAVFFALAGAAAALGMGNMAQVNTAAESAVSLAGAFSGQGGVTAQGEMLIRLGTGFVFALASALVLLGGMKSVGAVTEKLVPAMSVLYILGAALIIGANFEKAGAALGTIVSGAFRPEAVLGGGLGAGLSQSLRYGIGRGVFSNEAGLGSSPIAHASSSETDPAAQGLYGIFEVFADTTVICTLTALAILMSGAPVPYGVSTGAELTISAFETGFGARAAAAFISAETALFALATVLSWALYGSRCVEFIFGTRVTGAYKAVYIAFIVIGAVLHMALVWEISDTLNGLMAIPNLIAILALSGHVVRATKAHFGK